MSLSPINNHHSLDHAFLATSVPAHNAQYPLTDAGAAALPVVARPMMGRPATTQRTATDAVRTPRVSVVIPALNEADNLPHVLPRIPAWVDEVLLVDGNSTDDTVAVARRLRPDVRIVYQEGRGKGAALRSGFAAATGDIIVMLDADGSTDPMEMELFVHVLCNGADFVKASRFLQGAGTSDMPIHRRLGNEALTLLVRLLFGGQFSDLCYGYNAFWARVLPLLELDGDGFEIETMMNVRALRAGLKVVEMPSFEAERVHGVGNLRTIPDGWRVLKTIVKERIRSQRTATHHLLTHTAQRESVDAV